MNLIIRKEEEKDYNAVENLTREAFWDLYGPGCDEHLILHQLRKTPAFVKELSYAAWMDGRIVGQVTYSIAKIQNEKGKEHEVLCMGPISVLPGEQGKGIGSRLLKETLMKARERGYNGVVIFGDPGYYGRFGFQNAKKYNFQTDSGENFDEFMALELQEEGFKRIRGRFYIDKAFRVKEEELEEFEKGFPYKEKNFQRT